MTLSLKLDGLSKLKPWPIFWPKVLLPLQIMTYTLIHGIFTSMAHPQRVEAELASSLRVLVDSSTSTP